MQFDPSYQNRYMAYPMNPREQDGYPMNAYAPPPPGMLHLFFSCLQYALHPASIWVISSLATYLQIHPLTSLAVYEHNYQNTPAYVPPQGASKVNPDQHDYAAIPPPGAPPARNYDAPTYKPPAAGSSARDQT